MESFAPRPSTEKQRRGRGATINPMGRFDTQDRFLVSDEWESSDHEEERLQTSVTIENAKSIITKNNSSDLPFDQSINPYRGCEHGCIYCFARPTHSYFNLSPGLDFETKLFAKPNAAELLTKEIRKKNYICKPIALGTNTDPYQPIEKQRKITRSVLKTLAAAQHPFTITTKSDLVLRDLDILAPLAAKKLVTVGISVTSLDLKLSRLMEPRASTPQKRLNAIRSLSDAGIPVVAQIAPVIPAINDTELEKIMQTTREYGAKSAIYLMVRLPHEVSELFNFWLFEHFPDRADKVMKLIRSIRDGKENDPNFGSRMRGKGPYADMIERRFVLASKKLGFSKRKYDLATHHFKAPVISGDQLDLF
ncbi:MAG: PA0069 family radical SAM protein [Sneathiella sp.]|nr:PA0069 family radical SAM protein [Sneathiella sp.]